MVSVILKNRILFLCINIDIIIVISVIMKKIKIIFVRNYLRCCKIPKGCISDYVDIVEITSTQDYTRLAWSRFPEQKMLENDRMKTASTEVMSIRRQKDIEKSTWKTHRYVIDFESQIHVKISLPIRCHNFHVDSSFKIYEILTNFPRGISKSNRW